MTPLDLPVGRRGRVLAVALPLVVLAVLWIGVVQPAIDWYGARAERLERDQALAARMAALADAMPALQSQLAASSARALPQAAMLEGGNDGIAAAGLQGRLQDLASAAGASLTSVETLPPEQVGLYRRLGVRVSLTAMWPVLIHLLESAAQANPRMLVDDLQVHAAMVMRRTETTPVDVTFSVFGFRATPPEASR